MCKNVLKWRTFELTGWITGKRLKIVGYMLRCVWQALNPLSTHVTAIVPGTYPWRPKCVLYSLDVAKCLHPQHGEGNDLTAWLSWGSEIVATVSVMQLTRDVFAIAKFLLLLDKFCYKYWWKWERHEAMELERRVQLLKDVTWQCLVKQYNCCSLR